MEMSLKSMYERLKEQPTPAQAFIKDLARVTCKSEHSVRMWVLGRQVPDELTREVIANYYGIPQTQLFNNVTPSSND